MVFGHMKIQEVPVVGILDDVLGAKSTLHRKERWEVSNFFYFNFNQISGVNVYQEWLTAKNQTCE